MSDPQLLTIRETRGILRIGRSAAYELVRSGELPHIRLGTAIRVPRQALEDWITSQTRGDRQGTHPAAAMEDGDGGAGPRSV